ncbi:helix-turn-helix domain-containing protein [Candidatus Parvarchaeota archaeon]|nr:helix-turn-helix domain-containing protein [Candidatus Parvarchaeota archaeon]
MLPELSEIRKKRLQQNLSQSQLASRCFVSQSLIAKIESGKAIPSYSNAKQIFDYFESCQIKSQACALDLLSPDIVSLDPKESVPRAVKLLAARSISQAPVIKQGVQVGSFSEETVSNLVAAKTDSAKLHHLKVGDVMGQPFPQIPTKTPAFSVAALLASEKAVLVADKSGLKGIITKADLLKVVR